MIHTPIYQILSSLAAVAVIGSILGFNFYLLAADNWKRRARLTIESGIKKGTINWLDIVNVAERWSQDRKSVLFILRCIHGKAVSGEDQALATKIDKIRSFLNLNEQETPFVELPENISIQLASISAQYPASKPQIRQLAVSLSDIYDENRRDSRKTKQVGFWSLIIGVAGLLFAVATLFPEREKQPNKPETAAAVSGAPIKSGQGQLNP